MPAEVDDRADAPLPPSPADDPRLEEDDRYQRRTHTFDPDSLKRLDRLCERFGKSASEVLRLGLTSLEGNQRLYRHAIAQPLCALKLIAQLARVKARDQEDHETAADLAAVVVSIEELFLPPDPENRGA